MRQSSVLVCGLLFAVSASAVAMPIGTDTTGFADTLAVWSQTQNDADRVKVVADYLQLDAKTVKLNFVTLGNSGGEGGLWQQVGSTLWAFDLGSTPSLFLIKTGNGVSYSGVAGNTALYLNNGTAGSASNRYGVIDLGVFGRDRGKVEIAMVSHVSVSVPEPGTLVLLGSGLLGFGLKGLRRRRT